MKNPRKEPMTLHVHIPKAGGSTVDALGWLNMQRKGGRFWMHGFNKPPRVGGRSELDRRWARMEHKVDFAGGHMAFGYHERYHFSSREHRYVTVMREPVSRVVSELWYVQHTKNYFEGHNWLEPQVTMHHPPEHVKPFVGKKSVGPIEQIERGWILSDITFEMLQQEPGESVETVKNRLRTDFTVVGLLEQFPETLALARGYLGLADVAITKRRTNSKRKSVAETLEMFPGLEETIKRHNARDIELYEYVRDVLLPAQLECFGSPEELAAELARIGAEQAKADSEPPVYIQPGVAS